MPNLSSLPSVTDWLVAGILIAGIAALLAWRFVRTARLVARLEQLLAPEDDRHAGRLGRCVEAVERLLSATNERTAHSHKLTGLPTREPLVARMIEDQRGILGTIGFVDFDRLSAFDPAQGDRALLTLVDRMARMLGRRLIAQVDRAQFAIWFGPDVAADEAKAELDAIAYALGNAIGEGPAAILPEIRSAHARYPEDGATPQLLLMRALAAMSLGKAALVHAEASVAETIDAARERYAMEQDLRHAIARGEFAMQYQPLIDAAAGRTCGAEALIRWNNAERGRVSPARFVPVMEAMGLADDLGLWTLNAACRAARGWQAGGLQDLRVAVNISAHQLDRADMQALVERTLARHSLSPSCLELELTESVATGDTDRASRLFDSLRALGAKVAIDDFGTGFSSFSALKTLRFDKIKIDREFVTAVDTRRDSQAICQSIIALGRGLGIRVLAEGVERREEYRWLRQHGCTHFQGYYFSMPLDDAAFVAFAGDTKALAKLIAIDPKSLRDDLSKRLTA